MSITLADLNELDKVAFTDQLGSIYEDSPWVAAKSWDARPFSDVDALNTAMQSVVAEAGREAHLKLLRQHPRLGIAANLTGHSRAEQSGAGLMTASDDERRVLHDLNEQYQTLFGFPYIVAVKGLSVSDIISDCRMRVGNKSEIEFEAALEQVYGIARNRLADMIATHS